MADTYAGRERWAQKTDPKERAAAVTKTLDTLRDNQKARIQRARLRISMYEGRLLPVLNASSYFLGPENDYSTDQYDAIRINLARALVNTAVAKVAGKQRPKAQFCVNKSDWGTKHKAKKQEKFVEAVMLSRHGAYHDGWDVGLDAFADCAICDCGVLKTWADHAQKRIVIERVLPWEVIVDPAEAKYRAPRNLFHQYGYDRQTLANTYPKYADEIKLAKSVYEEGKDSEDAISYGEEASDQIFVREAWRLPYGLDKGGKLIPGRHSMVIAGVDVLADTDAEEWLRPTFPFEFMAWERQRVGMFGTSLVDNVYHLNDELNEEFERWCRAQRLCSNGVTFYEANSVESKDLESNALGISVPYKQGSPMPVYVAPNAISEMSLRFLEMCWGKGFETSGVSQMAATGQKDPGVTAAIAMRTVENIASERFAVPWQMYERTMAIGETRQIIACAKELAEVDPGFAVNYTNEGSSTPLKWKDVEVDLPDEAIQVYAVSGLVNTPTDRLQLASELLDRGAITMESYLEVIQAKNIAAELDRGNSLTKWLDRQIEAWLDYEPGAEADPAKFRYRVPLKFIGIDGLTECIVRAGREYLAQDAEDCPDEKLAWFVRFMGDCDAQIQGLKQKAAELEAAARGAASPPPAEGAPPGSEMGAMPPLGGAPDGPAPMPIGVA